MKNTGEFLFKYRSYTPLPLFILMILFINPHISFLISGFFVAAIGEAIRLWSVSYAGSETRTTISTGGTQLVTQGPYSVIRNPLYLGNIFIYSGIGIMSNSLFPYLQIFALIYFHIQYHLIILVEEEYLFKRFKGNYILYKQCVNKFLPNFKTIPDSIKSNLDFDLNEGLKSEVRSLEAYFVAITLILLFYFTGIRIIIY